MLFLLEDAHWVDNSTETLIGEVTSAIADAPVIMLVTYRPDEYSPPWPALPHASHIDLRRLPARDGGEIVEALARGGLPRDVVEEILERSDCVPLYVEELTRSSMEGDGEGVPASLQASLTARLDQLGEVKELAQSGAVIGREFSFAMIDALLGGGRANQAGELERLVASELVYQVGTGVRRKYVFKHALIQDAAYAGLLNTRWRALHGAVARILRQIGEDSEATQPEILARHLAAADEGTSAAEQWRVAGQRAAALSAMEEAESCYGSGLGEFSRQPPSDQVDRVTFDLRLAMASLYFGKEGPKSAVAESVYLSARELGERIGDVERHNAVSWGLWGLYWNRGETEKGAPYAYEQLDRLDDESHPFAVSIAHRSVAVSEMTLGDFVSAAAHAESACEVILSSDDGQNRLALRPRPQYLGPHDVCDDLGLQGACRRRHRHGGQQF